MNGPADLWSSFTHDPRQPANAGLRASDGDRGVVQQLLTEAYADGRLDREEFDSRSADAVGARTLGELPALVSDLVATESGASSAAVRVPGDDLQRQAVARYESDRREAVLSFLGPSIVCVVIWLLIGGGGLFWPGFVIAGTGINLMRSLIRRQDMIESNRRRLEKKQQHRELDHKPDEGGGE